MARWYVPYVIGTLYLLAQAHQYGCSAHAEGAADYVGQIPCWSLLGAQSRADML